MKHRKVPGRAPPRDLFAPTTFAPDTDNHIGPRRYIATHASRRVLVWSIEMRSCMQVETPLLWGFAVDGVRQGTRIKFEDAKAAGLAAAESCAVISVPAAA